MRVALNRAPAARAASRRLHHVDDGRRAGTGVPGPVRPLRPQDRRPGRTGNAGSNELYKLSCMTSSNDNAIIRTFAEALGVAGGTGVLRKVQSQSPGEVLHDAKVLQARSEPMFCLN